MNPADSTSEEQVPWRSDVAPCIYCGQIVSRREERCPHCRASFSTAVRKASREVLGPWYYLDARNPSGRGVTFETIIKMAEKGRIRPDSVVRGPTTHQDWMYAAETPRLAKYLGMCPHCFAEAKPEEAYCSRCQLNMNTRPADVRPGIPPDLVGEPVHRAAYEAEKELARGVRPAESLAGEPLDVPGVVPRSESPAEGGAAVVAAELAARAVRKRSGREPKSWVVLALTWGTLVFLSFILVFTPALLWLTPEGWHTSILQKQDRIKSAIGLGPSAPETRPAEPAAGDTGWLNEQLRAADEAEGRREYDRAIRIYKDIVAKTGDTTLEASIQRLERKVQQEHTDRLAKLKGRLELAEKMAEAHRYDDAFAILRNIGAEDRSWLAGLGVSVEKMETTFSENQKRWLQESAQEEQLTRRLAEAARLRGEKRLKEAMEAYQRIRADFPADRIRKHVDLDRLMLDLRNEIAASLPPPAAPEPAATEKPAPQPPEPPPVRVMTPEEAAAAVAGLLKEATALEEKEKFAEALAKLEEIRGKFERKYWPEGLEERIRRVEAKKKAMEFFGM